MNKPSSTTLYVIENIPFIKAGNDIGTIIVDCVKNQNLPILDGDVLVVAQKIVSRAENRTVLLNSVTPSKAAEELAAKTECDPRLCQLILDNGRVLYCNGRAIITEDRLGIVNTSAGIDRSNSGSPEGEIAVLLPENPDQSARKIREVINKSLGVKVAIIISDSLGRPWRNGAVGMAIGLAGIAPVETVERRDLSGRLIHPKIARVDEISSAASILMGQADEGYPVVIVRGVSYTPDENADIKKLLRPVFEDQVW